MSNIDRAGTLLWYFAKATEVAEWGKVAIETTDPSTQENALFQAATKLSELAGISRFGEKT